MRDSTTMAGGALDIDRPSNGVYLPETPEVRVPNDALPMHSGSHPAYSAQTRIVAQRTLAEVLESSGKNSVAELTDAQLLEALQTTENRMRAIVESMSSEAYVR